MSTTMITRHYKGKGTELNWKMYKNVLSPNLTFKFMPIVPGQEAEAMSVFGSSRLAWTKKWGKKSEFHGIIYTKRDLITNKIKQNILKNYKMGLGGGGTRL